MFDVRGFGKMFECLLGSKFGVSGAHAAHLIRSIKMCALDAYSSKLLSQGASGQWLLRVFNKGFGVFEH